METKDTYTLEELKKAATEQHLQLEERNGKYKVVRRFSEQFVVVEAGAGYSLDRDGLREFLLFNAIGIGERLTDWSTGYGHKLNQPDRIDTTPTPAN
jgi:hypothetical protein